MKEYSSQPHQPEPKSFVPSTHHVQKPVVIASVPVEHHEKPAQFPEKEYEKPADHQAPVFKPHESSPPPAQHHGVPVKEYSSQPHQPEPKSFVPPTHHVQKPVVIASVPVEHHEKPAQFPEKEYEKPADHQAPVFKPHESSQPPAQHHGVPMKEYSSQPHQPEPKSFVPSTHHVQKPVVIASVPVEHHEKPAQFPEKEYEKPADHQAPVFKPHESSPPPAKQHHGVPMKEYSSQPHQPEPKSFVPSTHHVQKPVVIASVPVEHHEKPAQFPEKEYEKPADHQAPVSKPHESSPPPAQHHGVPVKEYSSQPHQPEPKSFVPPTHHVQKPVVIASVPVEHHEKPAQFPEKEYEKPADHQVPVFKPYESSPPPPPYRPEKSFPAQNIPVHSVHPDYNAPDYSPMVHLEDKPTTYVKPINVPILPYYPEDISYTEHMPVTHKDDIDYRIYKKYPGYIPEETEFDRNVRLRGTVNEYIKRNWNVFENTDEDEKVDYTEGRPQH
ncbi:uncharacterized protein LOC129798453 isoform X2 [Phlebotomus papatasi]|uniref:uncharacterized protein LOC129798453 isoform X2 n=1 Tax=Phlebotomus papatasi TaxID=29031 RepID=UPI002483F911|nr:uncharacterized protein LOC129798453 isoform X2 [Phlebotomus papatasi]